VKRYRERCEVLEASYRETAEDYLRVTLIRSGDSVIIIMKRLCTREDRGQQSKQGGTARMNSSLTVRDVL